MLLQPNKFQSFQLTDEEYKQAMSFTNLQLAFFQTELAAKAERRLTLRFDPLQPHLFLQEEAYLVGQMELLESLITPTITASQTKE